MGADPESLFREAWKLLDAGKDRLGFQVLMAAARRGHLESQQGVGYLYDVGRGIRRSEKTALVWCRKAARRGDASAANDIGILHRDRQLRGRAMHWFPTRKAAP